MNTNTLLKPIKQVFKQKIKSIRSIWENGGNPVPVMTKNTQKFSLWCCACAWLRANNNTTEWELDYQLERLKQDSKYVWNVQTRSSGEKSFLCIVSPGEDNLKNLLIEKGFVKIWELPRRNGYPQSNLELYGISI
jgi:hypothetical protein